MGETNNPMYPSRWHDEHHGDDFFCAKMALHYISLGHHLFDLEWLHENCDRAVPAAMDEAARAGHLDVLKWLNEHGYEGCQELRGRIDFSSDR